MEAGSRIATECVEFPQAAVGDQPAAAALLRLDDALAEDRILIVAGGGDGFVLAGPLGDRGVRDLLSDVCDRLANHRYPVLAASPGPLLDAGLELALACDLRYAAPAVEVGLPSAIDGGLPCGGAQRLARLGSASLAARSLLLGETSVTGADPSLDRFLDVGDAPQQRARDAAQRLSTKGPLALEAIKTALRAAQDLPLDGGLAVEADLACLLLGTADRQEGLAAWQERRAPGFGGV